MTEITDEFIRQMISGIGIFYADLDKVKSIMDEDPAAKEGVFFYEIHARRSFPGDCLPE